MALPEQPRLRRVESFPVSGSGGEVVFALRDPEGFSEPIVLPYPAAVLASLMDGSRTPCELQNVFREKTGHEVSIDELARLVHQLDERWYMDTDRFRARWKRDIELYLNSKTRLPAHAGRAYAADPQALRAQLAGLFTASGGPGTIPEQATSDTPRRLSGVMSPHIDFQRGGATAAWAYKRLVEQSDADLFVIFGTAHNPMRSRFSITRKHFETPLGTVETDRAFITRLNTNLASTPGGAEVNLFADELAHRQEHSIEFQVVFLQYLLADKRPFKIVPVLTGSFHDFIRKARSPAGSPEVQAFVAAMRQTAEAEGQRVGFISGVDLAHIGQRYGDRSFLDAGRLTSQAEDDRQLLAALERADAEGFFRHVAGQGDRNRVCGLSPAYTMLEVLKPRRGELLKYDQAVELDGTACVSFASMAFYSD